MTQINNLIEQAKAQGFEAYAPEKLTTYFYFTDGEKIGYCQADPMRGPSFATVHKPNRTTGTGYKAASFAEALQFAPSWATGGDRSTVQKYANWQEFSRKHWQPLAKQ